MFQTIEKILAALEGVATVLAAATILLLGTLISLSVLGRATINVGIPDVIVLAGLLMIPVIALPMAHVQASNGHIAVTVTTDWLPRRLIALLQALGNLIGFVFFGAIAWFLTSKIPRDLATGAFYDGELELPVWPMKVVFAIGIGLFLLRLIFEFIRNLSIVAGFPANTNR